MALIVIFLAVSAAMPSASADNERRHRRHIEHFLVLSTNADATNMTMVGKGPIHARGVDHQLSDTRDAFQFAHGTVYITHHQRGRVRNTFDHVTCYLTYKEHGTYTVTSGTGAYANARGHGHYKVNVSGVGCDQNKAPDVFMLEIRASGPLHF